MKIRYIIVFYGLIEYGPVKFGWFSKTKEYNIPGDMVEKTATKFICKFTALLICKYLNFLSLKNLQLRTFKVNKLYISKENNIIKSEQL